MEDFIITQIGKKSVVFIVGNICISATWGIPSSADTDCHLRSECIARACHFHTNNYSCQYQLLWNSESHNMSSSSDSDFEPKKHYKRRKISRTVKHYLEENEESSDDKTINLWENLSDSSEECEQPAGTGSDSNKKGVNITFDLGLTQLIHSTDDTDDNVPLSERLKRKKADHQQSFP